MSNLVTRPIELRGLVASASGAVPRCVECGNGSLPIGFMDSTDAPEGFERHSAAADNGLLVAGQLWRLLRGTACGIREGRVMLDRCCNPYRGAEFPVPAIVDPRMATFTLPVLSTAEARRGIRFGLRRFPTAWRSATATPSGGR